MNIPAKLPRALIVLLYIGAMGYATVSGFIAPYRNWDMLGYMGSVISWHAHTPQAIYSEVMSALRLHVPDWMYQQFAENPLSAEAKAFVEQLPIYQVKPLYNGFIWLLHQIGIALPVATWVVSATCFGMLSVLLFFWRPRYMSHSIWLLLVVGLTYLWPWPMISLACLSTPDSIATLLTTAAAYSWLMRRSLRWFCVFCWLAVLARPDALILCGALTAYCALFAPKPYRMPLYPALCLIVISVITYLTVSRLSGNYGLERWFIYAFIDKTPYPAEATDHLTPERYWNVLSPSFLLFISLGRTITMVAFSAIACLACYFKPAEGNLLWLHLMLLVWACITLRFLMFPAWGDDRYYFVYYLPILFAGGELIAPYAGALWRSVQAHRKNMEKF